MKIATDSTGKVWLTGTGPFPGTLNGIALTERELTTQEERAYHDLPPERGGAVFAAGAFTAMPKSSEPLPEAEITAEELHAAMLKKGGVPTREEVMSGRTRKSQEKDRR